MLTPNALPAERLAANIADMPKGLQTGVREGFEIAAGLSDADREKIANAVLASVLAGRDSFSRDIITDEVNVSDSDASRLLLALATTSAFLIEYPVSPEEFVAVGREILFSENATQVAFDFVAKIGPNRPALETSVSRMDLANQVLPLFEH